MVKKAICILLAMSFVTFHVLAQGEETERESSEIPNLVSAVRDANPGDYILLPSGRSYILTKEEIDIVNGAFDFGDLSGVPLAIRDDGTEIRTISEAHIAYIFPDGQSAHLLKTSISFTAFLDYIEENYHIVRYVDNLFEHHDLRTINSPRFNVFRARVQIQFLSDGHEEIEDVSIEVYNFRDENFLIRFASKSGLVWGNVNGTYRPTGETRYIDFDIE